MKKILTYIVIIISIMVCLIGILLNNKKDNLKNVYDSVVYIEAIDEMTINSGSGFVYKTEDNINYIITSYHVIEGYTNIYIYNNDKEKINANVLNYDEYTDIAVLTIEDGLSLKEIDIGNSDEIIIQDKIYIVGTPIDISNINTISSGEITFVNKKITIETTHGSSNLDTIQVNADVNYGNSGGPLLNKFGKVIGMMFVKEVDGFALPINFVMDIVEKLENDELKRPNLGAVMCNTTNTEVLNEYQISIDNIDGVALLVVNEDYSLYNAGLKNGDVIIKFNAVDISNVNVLREELYKRKEGDVVFIEYYRDGKYYKVEVQL